MSPRLSSHSPVVTPLQHPVFNPTSSVPSHTVTPSHVSQSITAAANSYPEIHVELDFSLDSLQVVLPIPPLNLHPMQTMSKSGIVKKKALLTTFDESTNVDLYLVEPATYKSALKVPVWMNAMKEELDALYKQGTWSLVSLPLQKNLVGYKWVFKIKKHSDGSIARHKTRLVAKGFSQEPDSDYGKTFSHVVKPTIVRIILALATQFDWPLRQLDVKNVFLHVIL
ncbi:hypothetical protein PS2_001873 [Malus domestica]